MQKDWAEWHDTAVSVTFLVAGVFMTTQFAVAVLARLAAAVLSITAAMQAAAPTAPRLFNDMIAPFLQKVLLVSG